MGPSLQLRTCVLFWGFLGLLLFVAMVTRLPGAKRGGVLITPAKYEVDRSTGVEVMGIFCKLRN